MGWESKNKNFSPYAPMASENMVSEKLSNPDLCFQKLMQKVSGFLPGDSWWPLLSAAFEYARKRHGDQVRRSGEPYITHPLEVASILADLNVDVASLAAAILHDVVEDTDTTIAEIEHEFGQSVSGLVDGLTKISKMRFRSSEERLAENFRKMVLAMAKDIRVILIKLADRLHNMRTLGILHKDKRRRIAQETLDIYAPLASRLGIYGIKSELEDLCLKETNNEVYKQIRAQVAAKKDAREKYIIDVIGLIEQELEKYGFKAYKVYGRPKHFYSIYKKMVSRKLAFEDIHDLFAFRIIVGSVKDCYEVLGIIHAMWKPMPGRFKDYIAMPKANLYQSLHTTVVRPNGPPAEIQIRTHEMHRVCEFGIAAHWVYKEKGQGVVKQSENQTFSWLRQMMELHHDVKDPNEFLDAVKMDLFEEEIFVFTPRGDVIQLAQGATPVDFAFAVHSDLGLTTVGARVNGKMVPLRSKVVSGDIVEVLTSPNQKPNKDWLHFVTTSKARNKIRSFLRTEQRERGRKLGKEMLAGELDKLGMDLATLIDQGKVESLVKMARESTLESLYIVIGYGKVSPRDLLQKVFPPEKTEQKQEGDPAKATAEGDLCRDGMDEEAMRRSRHSGVLVSGLDNILVTYGRCCHPLPGDPILGFVTRGRGISIHRSSCNRALDLDPQRRIAVQWVDDGEQEPAPHSAFLSVVTRDRHGLLAEVTLAIAEAGANVIRARVKVNPDSSGELDFEISLSTLQQLNDVMDRIKNIPDVVLVERRHHERRRRGGDKSRHRPE